jgi:hypothetical protein
MIQVKLILINNEEVLGEVNTRNEAKDILKHGIAVKVPEGTAFIAADQIARVIVPDGSTEKLTQ